MNRLPQTVETGTLGELLVQIRLLEYGVQAAAPLKDSGNDFVALRGRVIKTIQVKTRTGTRFELDDLPEFYDFAALVHLRRNGTDLALDESLIYLVPAERCQGQRCLYAKHLEEFRLTPDLVARFFA
jgi:hypothetical protein